VSQFWFQFVYSFFGNCLYSFFGNCQQRFFSVSLSSWSF
jgi:hypothetical protein